MHAPGSTSARVDAEEGQLERRHAADPERGHPGTLQDAPAGHVRLAPIRLLRPCDSSGYVVSMARIVPCDGGSLQAKPSNGKPIRNEIRRSAIPVKPLTGRGALDSMRP